MIASGEERNFLFDPEIEVEQQPINVTKIRNMPGKVNELLPLWYSILGCHWHRKTMRHLSVKCLRHSAGSKENTALPAKGIMATFIIV